MGEDVSDMATTTSQLQAKLLALTGGKVDIMLDENTFKNSTQILREMAAAWEDMNDIQRASALELMGGKRQANVLSALIQNFDTVEEAIEVSANSAGSALKENERYLDSIQGRVDQFNNSVQSMWSNAIDSDFVKGLVNIGTALVKIVDKVGLLNVSFVGLFAFLSKKYGFFDNLFKTPAEKAAELQKKLDDVTSSATAVSKKMRGKQLSLSNRTKKLESQGMTAEQIQADPKIQQWTKEIEDSKQKLAAYNQETQKLNTALEKTNATTQRGTVVTQASTAAQEAENAAERTGVATETAEAAAESASTNAKTGKIGAMWASVTATGASIKTKLADVAVTTKQLIADKLRNSWLIRNAIAQGVLTTTEAASLPITGLLTKGILGLAASFGTLWATIWPVLVIIGLVAIAFGAVALIFKGIDAIIKTTEELQEELDKFKSSLSDIREELDSVNQELESTNERMNELLAKDKLTFEEQEELDRLRETNAELERRKELLENEETYKKGLVGRQAARVVNSVRKEGATDREDDVQKYIDEYAKQKESLKNAKSLFEVKNIEEKMESNAIKIDEYISTLSDALDGVEYGDSDESDAALDYLAQIQDQYSIARGDAGAETRAIKDIMKKDEFSSMSNAINYYVEALKNGDADAEEAIKEIINNNEEFVQDLHDRGLDAQKAIDLYTQLGQDMSFATIEGKMKEIQRATKMLPDAFNDIGQFIDDGLVDKTAIAKYFTGTSEKTREEIAKLIQDINDGNIDIENALKKFDVFGVQSVLEIEITEVQTNFKDVFTDLEDADGLIDTFNELADAIGSTSNALDALNTAQAEMEAGGRVSIETAMKLREYTDDYSKVLTISEGKVVLAENAEENLIDARLEGMKASALKALEEAKAARETTVLSRSTAETALSTYNSAIETEMAAAVTATAWDKVLATAAGLWAGIKSLFTDESWTEAYDRAFQETLNSLGEDKVTAVENKYASAEEKAKKAQLEQDIEDANKSIEEQDKEIDKLQGNYDLISGLNKDNVGDVFKSDGFDDPDDVKDDAFQRDMDYWENRIGANQARYEQLQNEIDLLEAKGQKADASYYQEQIELENERLRLLNSQKEEAQKYLTGFTNEDGEWVEALEEGSEEWWEVANTLNDIEGELDDVTASIVDLQDAIGEIDAYKFDEFNTRLDNLTSKLSTIRDLIAPDGEEEWFDDEGNWTDTGIAVAGTYLQELEMYKQGYQKTIDELARYESPYVGNEDSYASLGIHSEQEYYDKTEELISQQYDFAESISDTEQSIVDMYESSIDATEEYIETLIDGYNDYIDSVKEALDAERD